MKKIILIFLLAPILCFGIYKMTYKKRQLIVAFGDTSCLASSIYGVNQISYNYYLSKYLKASLNDAYCQKNLKVSDLYSIIKSNKNQILKYLDEASYVTIMIGYDELISHKEVNNTIKKDFLETYNDLLKTIAENTKAQIIVIGFYPNYFNGVIEINSKLNNMSTNINAIFINPSSIIKNNNNFYNINCFHLNKTGNKEIFEIIRNKL